MTRSRLRVKIYFDNEALRRLVWQTLIRYCDVDKCRGHTKSLFTEFGGVTQPYSVFLLRMKPKAILMDELNIKRALTRISYEIIETADDIENVVLLGIRTRGIPMAERISYLIAAHSAKVPVGKLDISFYRDDVTKLSDSPELNGTDVPFDVTGKDVIIVDDVLYTGRTARAALEATIALGRPRTVKLAILIDRGHRELPIRADFVGKNVPTSAKELIAVHFTETDGRDDVELFEKE